MQASAETIWSAAQEHLRSMLSADTYNLWFAPLRAAGHGQQRIVLEVANDFCEVWLKDNYMGLLAGCGGPGLRAAAAGEIQGGDRQPAPSPAAPSAAARSGESQRR